jgi:hypothetical protein
MFVLCVLYRKGQKAKPGQAGQRIKDKVWRTKKVGSLKFFIHLMFRPQHGLGVDSASNVKRDRQIP